MELGETVCLPGGIPDCAGCPLADTCRAAPEELWRTLPVLPPKKPRRQEERTVFLLVCGDRLALRKRPPTGLLAGLWELPGVEGALSPAQVLAQAEAWLCAPRGEPVRRDRSHAFTHVEWTMAGYRVECAAAPADFVWATRQELGTRYALPTAFRQFLADAALPEA